MYILTPAGTEIRVCTCMSNAMREIKGKKENRKKKGFDDKKKNKKCDGTKIREKECAQVFRGGNKAPAPKHSVKHAVPFSHNPAVGEEALVGIVSFLA